MVAADLPQQAEVGQLGDALRQQNVGRLDVAVQKGGLALMQEVEPLGDIAEIAQQFVNGQAFPARLLAGTQAIFQRAAVGQLHFDEEPIAFGPGFFRMQKKRMMEVLEGGERFQLPLGLVGVHRFLENLESDIQVALFGLPDFAERAFADFLDETIFADREAFLLKQKDGAFLGLVIGFWFVGARHNR